MASLTPDLTLLNFAMLFLWCYAAVLAVAWFRAVGAEDCRTHIGHFVGLMGVFVPISCSFVLTLLLGAVLQLPYLIVMLVVLMPAGLVVGLQLEVSRLTGSTDRMEALRLGATCCLALGTYLCRTGF